MKQPRSEPAPAPLPLLAAVLRCHQTIYQALYVEAAARAIKPIAARSDGQSALASATMRIARSRNSGG